jgi:hypothetical protein
VFERCVLEERSRRSAEEKGRRVCVREAGVSAYVRQREKHECGHVREAEACMVMCVKTVGLGV